jgi:hypothetical protein
MDYFSRWRSQKNGLLVREVIPHILLTLAQTKISVKIMLMEKSIGFIMLTPKQILNTIEKSTNKGWNALFIGVSMT